MSYYGVPPGNADRELGRRIYMEALSDRRGFREDQLGIFEEDIWAEIFEHIGQAARSALSLPTPARDIKTGGDNAPSK